MQSSCLPNKDFVRPCSRPNKHSGVSFRSSFQWIVAQILYSHPGKAHRNETLKCLFGLPKYSFGEHDVVTKDKVVTKDSTQLIRYSSP